METTNVRVGETDGTIQPDLSFLHFCITVPMILPTRITLTLNTNKHV
jgi:hypothetical protein